MGQSYKTGLICSAVEIKYGNMGLTGHEVSLFGSFSFSGSPKHTHFSLCLLLI